MIINLEEFCESLIDEIDKIEAKNKNDKEVSNLCKAMKCNIKVLKQAKDVPGEEWAEMLLENINDIISNRR